MAKDIWNGYTEKRLMDDRCQETVLECQRQEESCSYTSAALYCWLKSKRFWRDVMIVIPIIAGSLASAKLFAKVPDWEWLTAASAMLAGLFPLILKGLNFEGDLKRISEGASEFTILRDRFRQASRIGAHATAQEQKVEFEALMKRTDSARKSCPAIPERYFKQAQKKIGRGDYKFDSAKD
jgi:hypothetical protein